METAMTSSKPYQTELRRGVSGNGSTLFCLFVMDGAKTVFVHKFATKSEALAFHRTGANYGPLDDQS